MNNYEEIYKKLKKYYSDEEIAEGFMIPETLTPEELVKSKKELLKFRIQRLDILAEEQGLTAELAILREKLINLKLK